MSTKILKIIIIGDRGVGKSSLLRRYVNDEYVENPRSENILPGQSEEEDGLTADFVEKRVMANGKEVSASLWDQQSIAPPCFYNGTDGCCLVFSTIDEESLRRLEFWYDCVKKYCNGNSPPPIVIAENKIDLIDRSTIDADEVEKCVKQLKLRLYRTSAKTGHQVNELFEYIAGKAARFEEEQRIDIDQARASGSSDREGRPERTLSGGSWILPSDQSNGRVTEPSRRRTGGVKPLFNKNKCPIM